MDKNDRHFLRNQARQRLANASYSPKKLILLHTGAVLLLSFLLAVADHLLEQQIGSTSGLSGIGSRSVLATAQAMLRLGQTVLLPFWQMGYLYVTMKLAREEAVSPWDLCEGFRRFSPVLRLNLLKTAIIVGIGIVGFNITSTVFFLSPFAAPLMEALEPLLSDPSTTNDPAALQEILAASAEDVMIPLLIIGAIVILAISIPVLYHYRMASYFLMDSEKPRAFAAMRSSRKLMRYLCIDMFKLDASFWWFYLLEVLTGVLCYGDLILKWLGVTLPISAAGAYFLFLGLYLLSQLALYLWRKNELEVTYACAYEFLRSNHDPRPQPKPQNQPWVYKPDIHLVYVQVFAVIPIPHTF